MTLRKTLRGSEAQIGSTSLKRHQIRTFLPTVMKCILLGRGKALSRARTLSEYPGRECETRHRQQDHESGAHIRVSLRRGRPALLMFDSPPTATLKPCRQRKWSGGLAPASGS
jgi:hypothetical protein